MKKVLAVSMAALMATVSLSGCGASSSETKAAADTTAAAAESKTEETAAGEKAELTGELAMMVNNAFTGMDDPAIMRAAKQFEEDHPGVTITIEGLSGKELVSKFTTSAMAGSGPDIVALDNAGWPIDLAAMGLIIPLDDQIKASENDYLQGPLESGLYEGSYYSVPWYFNNTGLYYNKRILEEIGKTEAPTPGMNWKRTSSLQPKKDMQVSPPDWMAMQSSMHLPLSCKLQIRPFH